MNDKPKSAGDDFVGILGLTEKELHKVVEDTPEKKERKAKALFVIGGIAGFIYLGSEFWLCRHFIFNFFSKKSWSEIINIKSSIKKN